MLQVKTTLPVVCAVIRMQESDQLFSLFVVIPTQKLSMRYKKPPLAPNVAASTCITFDWIYLEKR